MSEDDEKRVMHSLRSAAIALRKKDAKLALRHVRVAESLIQLWAAEEAYGKPTK